MRINQEDIPVTCRNLVYAEKQIYGGVSTEDKIYNHH
jgi:hypothetical protein